MTDAQPDVIVHPMMTPDEFTNEAVPPRRREGWGEDATILVMVSSEDMHDPDLVPMYEDGKRCFYLGAWEDDPGHRVWAMFDQDVTHEEADRLVREAIDG